MKKEVRLPSEDLVKNINSVIDEHGIPGIEAEDFLWPKREYGAYCTVMVHLISVGKFSIDEDMVEVEIPEDFQHFTSGSGSQIKISLEGLEQWFRSSREFLQERSGD